MENEKNTFMSPFPPKKGGVGKTTFTVLAASYLYYLKGYDVAVVDCDYPQHSIAGMRKRDAEQVGADEDYKRMAYEQFTRLGKKAYPVLCSSPEKDCNGRTNIAVPPRRISFSTCSGTV